MCILNRIGNRIQEYRGLPPPDGETKAILFSIELTLLIISLITITILLLVKHSQKGMTPEAIEKLKLQQLKDYDNLPSGVKILNIVMPLIIATGICIQCCLRRRHY